MSKEATERKRNPEPEAEATGENGSNPNPAESGKEPNMSKEATEATEATPNPEPEATEAEAVVPEAPANGTPKAGTSREKLKELSDVTRQLIQLRREAESIDMVKAELLNRVKEAELYAIRGWTWSEYCSDIIGYHSTTVGRLLRCYNNPATREAYAELGKMKAFHVATMAKNLDGHMEPEAIDQATAEAIAYAKRNTVSRVKEHVDQVEAEATAEPEPEPGTLEALVERKKELQAEAEAIAEAIAELKEREAEIKAELKELDGQLAEAEAEA